MRLPPIAVPLALPLALLCACASPRVGALPSTDGTLPVVVIAWCGDDAPAQVDVTSSGISLHYRAVRPLTGTEVELDLDAPGPLWALEAGVSDGGRKSVMRPLADDVEVVVTVSSETTPDDRRGSGDLGEVAFTLDNLAEVTGIYLYGEDRDREVDLPRAEFALDC